MFHTNTVKNENNRTAAPSAEARFVRNEKADASVCAFFDTAVAVSVFVLMALCLFLAFAPVNFSFVFSDLLLKIDGYVIIALPVIISAVIRGKNYRQRNLHLGTM